MNKFICTTAIVMAMLATVPVHAEQHMMQGGGMQGGGMQKDGMTPPPQNQENSEARKAEEALEFSNRKEEMLLRMNNRLDEMKKKMTEMETAKSCISAATDREALHKCKPEGAQGGSGMGMGGGMMMGGQGQGGMMKGGMMGGPQGHGTPSQGQ